MARTEDEILESLRESLAAIDPSVDTRKGPVYDFLLRPVPIELQKVEADVERLTILTTIQLDQVITQAEAEAMATSFSIRLGGGKSSRSKNQVFFALQKPQEDIVIDRGNLVGTQDQLYTYFVSERVVMPAASAENFYNPQTRRYEITATCEATAVGPDYDLPPRRISRVITPIEGIDGTVNTTEYAGGEVSEALADSVDRIRAKFAGLDPESGGGVISDIRNFDAENVKDVSLVYPKDRSIFRRITNRPAIDAYVLGDQIETDEQIYVATGGETQIDIEKRPVRQVNSVTVNGTAVDFTLISDTTPEYGGSPRSSDYVLLDTALVAADSVVINYDYNALVYDLQAEVFGLERPFDTDVLAREPRRVGVVVSIDASIVASFDTARVYEAIEASLFDQIESDFFIDILQPEAVRQKIRDEVAGLNLLRITVFKRSSGSSLDVETIDLEKNEVSYVDQTQLNIQVRR